MRERPDGATIERMASIRNSYLGKQLREALRRSRWDGATIARRAYLPRETMARILIGDTTLSLAAYQVVAEQLEVGLELIPWAPFDQRIPEHVVETVVGSARRRLEARTLEHLGVNQKPIQKTPPPDVDDLSR